ncbi:uncharacterized protein TNCV_2988651 [Trichonephila clavipes]|nr:uncharacterized protein TNCV_2988651 [Trichonephila clavipes]
MSHNSLQTSMSSCDGSKQDDFSCSDETSSPHGIKSAELNDLVQDLNLFKSKADILEENIRVASFRTCHLLFEFLLKKEESFVFCCNTNDQLKNSKWHMNPINDGCL